MLQIRETIYGQKSGWACSSSGGMRVPACQGTLKAGNHIAPNIQSAMPAKTTAPQFNRIVFAPPEYARRRYPVLRFDATRAVSELCNRQARVERRFSAASQRTRKRRAGFCRRHSALLHHNNESAPEDYGYRCTHLSNTCWGV